MKPPSKERPNTLVGDRFLLTEVREDDLVCGIEVTPSTLHENETLSTHPIGNSDTYGSWSLSSNSLADAAVLSSPEQSTDSGALPPVAEPPLVLCPSQVHSYSTGNCSPVYGLDHCRKRCRAQNDFIIDSPEQHQLIASIESIVFEESESEEEQTDDEGFESDEEESLLRRYEGDLEEEEPEVQSAMAVLAIDTVPEGNENESPERHANSDVRDKPEVKAPPSSAAIYTVPKSNENELRERDANSDLRDQPEVKAPPSLAIDTVPKGNENGLRERDANSDMRDQREVKAQPSLAAEEKSSVLVSTPTILDFMGGIPNVKLHDFSCLRSINIDSSVLEGTLRGSPTLGSAADILFKSTAAETADFPLKVAKNMIHQSASALVTNVAASPLSTPNTSAKNVIHQTPNPLSKVGAKTPLSTQAMLDYDVPGEKELRLTLDVLRDMKPLVISSSAPAQESLDAQLGDWCERLSDFKRRIQEITAEVESVAVSTTKSAPTPTIRAWSDSAEKETTDEEEEDIVLSRSKEIISCHTCPLPLLTRSETASPLEECETLFKDKELNAIMELTGGGSNTTSLFPSVSTEFLDKLSPNEDDDDDDGLEGELSALGSIEQDIRKELEATEVIVKTIVSVSPMPMDDPDFPKHDMDYPKVIEKKSDCSEISPIENPSDNGDTPKAPESSNHQARNLVNATAAQKHPMEPPGKDGTEVYSVIPLEPEGDTRKPDGTLLRPIDAEKCQKGKRAFSWKTLDVEEIQRDLEESDVKFLKSLVLPGKGPSKHTADSVVLLKVKRRNDAIRRTPKHRNRYRPISILVSRRNGTPRPRRQRVSFAKHNEEFVYHKDNEDEASQFDAERNQGNDTDGVWDDFKAVCEEIVEEVSTSCARAVRKNRPSPERVRSSRLSRSNVYYC